MRSILAWIGLIGFCSVCFADESADPTWKMALVGNLNLTQASFSNWSQGGENTLGWQLTFDGRLVWHKGQVEVANRLRLGYGMTQVGEAEARKSVDELVVETICTYRAGLFVDPYVGVGVTTQMGKGYDYQDSSKVAISDFADPVYVTQSAGIGKRYGEVLRSRLGFALKQTFTDKYPTYSDDPSTEKVEKRRFEVGAELAADLNLKLTERILLTSAFHAFSNLKATNEIDVTWDTTLSAKVEKYLAVSLNVKVVYDRDVSKKRQIKEGLAIGLTYSFI